MSDQRNPATNMALFTVVVGTEMMGIRLAIDGHSQVALALAAAAGLVWLALTLRAPP